VPSLPPPSETTTKHNKIQHHHPLSSFEYHYYNAVLEQQSTRLHNNTILSGLSTSTADTTLQEGGTITQHNKNTKAADTRWASILSDDEQSIIMPVGLFMQDY